MGAGKAIASFSSERTRVLRTTLKHMGLVKNSMNHLKPTHSLVKKPISPVDSLYSLKEMIMPTMGTYEKTAKNSSPSSSITCRDACCRSREANVPLGRPGISSFLFIAKVLLLLFL